MTRRDKYPDTEVFKLFNANPKKRNTGDCVIRALSVALDKSYFDVLTDLQVLQQRNFYDIGDPKLYGKYLESLGWKKQKQPRQDNNRKYTGVMWCRFIKFWRNQKYNRMIAHIGGNHIVAIIDGKIIDTWDSSGGCIGNYWVKECE